MPSTAAAPVQSLTLLLADDHPLVLDSLRSLFEYVPWIGAIKLARDGLELCELAQACAPDATIVDLSMPRLDGLSSIRRLRHRDPHLAIVAITGATHWFPAAEVIAAGADEYLDKNQPGEAVVAALRRALAHHGHRIGALPVTPAPPPAQTEVALTEREREVLKLLAEGYDVEASANILAISPGTVRKHREHLFAKLETSNTAHLTLIAVRRGIVVGCEDAPRAPFPLAEGRSKGEKIRSRANSLSQREFLSLLPADAVAPWRLASFSRCPVAANPADDSLARPWQPDPGRRA